MIKNIVLNSACLVALLINVCQSNPKQAEEKTNQIDLEKVRKVGAKGNWIEKLRWIKQAQQNQAEIVTLYQAILQTRKNHYASKITKIENDLENFYSDLNFKRGNLTENLATIERELEVEIGQIMEDSRKSEVENLPEEIRFKIYEIDEKAANYKERLEQIKLDIEAIVDLEQSLEERVKVLDTSIAKSQKLLDQADDTIELMFEMVNHDKAREKSYEIQNHLKKMKAIEKYVQQEAKPPFDAEIQSLEEEMKKTKEEVELVKKSIKALQSSMQKLLFNTPAQIATESPIPKKIQPQSRSKEKNEGGAIFAVTQLFSGLYDIFSSLWKMVFG